jgi:MSHA pilin protein MshD
MSMTRAASRGFSLIELIVFIVVVAVGLAGVLSVMDRSASASADPMVRKQVVALAESVLEEALQKDFADPDGVDGETTRQTFDNVADYNGKTQAIFTDWPTGLSTYQVAIAVVDSTLGSGTTTAAKKVTVTVSGGGQSISLTGYRANY